MTNQQEVTQAAARGTLATFLLRIISFGCTQWTLRLLDPATLGKASIQLELLLSTVLFLSREGFRLALTRNISNDNWNVAWLSVPVATLVSVLALFYHLHNASESEKDYRMAGILFCLASCIEGWAEPCILLALRQMNVALKASAEGMATLAKTFAIVIALQYLQDDWPVTAFGLAQLVYAVVYALFLYTKTWYDLIGFRKDEPLDGRTCYMTIVFTGQGFFKHFLTEGDRFVLTRLSGSYDQGVYAMGSAYGGMAARIILQPIEENGRLLWSRQAAAESVEPLKKSYTVLVKLTLYVGFIFSCLAVNYTSIVLNVLAGRKWGNNQEATAVLTAFCVYTAFLAWNGMTEAFVYGVATSGQDMGRLGLVHTVVGILFALLASWAVPRIGTVGLVAANCIAMFLRALYSVIYAARYFAKRQEKPVLSTLGNLLHQMFPHRAVILAFAASFWVTGTSLDRFTVQSQELEVETGSVTWLLFAAQHIGVGVACVVGIISLAFPLENDFRDSVQSMWHGKQD